VIIRTFLGDISPADCGPCDAHEHLFLDTPAQPGEEFLDREKAVEKTPELVERGFVLAHNTLKPLLV
jgi:phosphotriesterase-related protein